MHNSRQLFAIFVLAICAAHVVSAESDTEHTNGTLLRSSHRTPFIVPISPPNFGGTPTLPTKTDERESAFARNKWDIDDNVAFASPVVPQPELIALPAPSEVALSDYQRWVSQIELKSETEIIAHVDDGNTDTYGPTDTQSKVVSNVASPNATVLGERITVHNLNVAAIEDQLRLRDEWTLEEIESAYEQVLAVEENRQLWTMYFDLLVPRKQRILGAPTSLSKCKELLRQRVFETQVALEINRFAVSKLDLAVARARLEEIGELLE